MKVPFSWLKEFVDIDIPAKELGERLFYCGFEVSELIPVGADISGVVVGYVEECEPIPDTHLHLCKVDAGTGELLQICCGADNVRAGGKYPTALVGATVYGTAKDHKTIEGVVTIKKGKMRGFESNGMLCSGTELGLTDDLYPGGDYSGLLVLPDDACVGDDVKPLVGLDDYIFDIDVPASRPDCQSVLGIAREVAAMLDKPLRMPATDYTESEYKFGDLNITVEAQDLCPRYIGHAVRGITPGQSPQWMRRNLALCGLRSISNVVDITNYVMLEIGQPMHAFDLDMLESTQIIVRRAAEGEHIVTLDGKEFALNNSNLVICDGTKPVALAGIMGGLNSEITPDTTDLLFESANFVRDNIRKTSRALGQSSDSSSRFEKGLSEYTCELGMARALHLIEELGCGEVTSSSFDVSAGAAREGKHFTCSVSGINSILGIDVPADKIVEILRSLNFEVVSYGDRLEVTAPRYREDIEVGDPDLAEEVIRAYGYDHLVPTFLKDASVTDGGYTPQQQRDLKARRVMCGQGCYETYTLAFYSDSDLDFLKIPAQGVPERNVIRIRNPINANLTIMRPLLVPSLLNVVVTNLKNGTNEGRLFELANVYVPKQQPLTELPDEIPHLGLAVFGSDETFFTVKGIIEGFADAFGLTFDYERADDVPYLHPGISAYVMCEGERAGVFGKLSNEITGELKIAKESRTGLNVFLGELDYSVLCRHMKDSVQYEPVPEFDVVTRDIALVADEDVACGDIVSEIRRACRQVRDVKLFDIYRGDQIGKGRKSMAFTLTFVPSGKAFSAKDIERFMRKIVGNLKHNLNADIR